MLPHPCFPKILARTTFVLESLLEAKNPGQDAIFGDYVFKSSNSSHCFSQILSSTPETWLQGMGTFISEKRHWAQVLVPATVYLILATVY